VRASVSWGPVTETVKSVGYLEAQRRVNVGSQVSGTVKELYADFNSIVKEGQLLAEIDPSQLEVQVAIQRANIERLGTDIASQEAQLADQRHQFDRTRQLHERGLQTDQQFEAAELALKNRESQIIASKKQLVQAQANLSAAELNLSHTKIYAPIDGVVIMRTVSPGQAVQASMRTPTLFMLCTPLQVLKLTAWVDEANIGRVRPGQEVGFQVGTYGSEMFRGTVDAIRLNAQRLNEIVTYPVWIHVPNDDLRLRPSMTAQVNIYVSQTEEVVLVPNDALRFRPTRAAYLALGGVPPKEDTQRAVDHMGDKVVDPTALRARAVESEAATIDELFAPLPVADSRATVWVGTTRTNSCRDRFAWASPTAWSRAARRRPAGGRRTGDRRDPAGRQTRRHPAANPLLGGRRGR
jgi:HlyD family secretion protein